MAKVITREALEQLKRSRKEVSLRVMQKLASAQSAGTKLSTVEELSPVFDHLGLLETMESDLITTAERYLESQEANKEAV